MYVQPSYHWQKSHQVFTSRSFNIFFLFLQLNQHWIRQKGTSWYFPLVLLRKFSQAFLFLTQEKHTCSVCWLLLCWLHFARRAPHGFKLISLCPIFLHHSAYKTDLQIPANASEDSIAKRHNQAGVWLETVPCSVFGFQKILSWPKSKSIQPCNGCKTISTSKRQYGFLVFGSSFSCFQRCFKSHGWMARTYELCMQFSFDN